MSIGPRFVPIAKHLRFVSILNGWPDRCDCLDSLQLSPAIDDDGGQGYQRELARLTPRAARLKASILSYEAAASLAMLDIERCLVRAPFAGSVQSVLVDAGDRVAPGVVVVTLVDSAHIEIPLQLPAASYDSVSVGSLCDLVSESMPGVSWRGSIARLAPVVDERTRTFAAYVAVDNGTQPRRLIPGTFLRAVVEGRTFHGRLLVPRSAIREGRVYVLEDGRAKPRSVTTHRTIVDRVIIAEGLDAGDRVILAPLDLMTDGLPVRTDERPAGSGKTGTASAQSVHPVTQSGSVKTP